MKRFHWILAFGIIAVDLAVKACTTAFLPSFGMTIFTGFLGSIDFSLVHASNKGAAWGIFSEYPNLLLGLRLLLIAGVFYYIIAKKPPYTTALVMVLAGALANVSDTLLKGEVIDMFKFVFWGYHYPVFNVADICIVLGIGWIILGRK